MSWITPISLFTNITLDQDGVGPDRGLEHVEVEQAVFLHVEVGHLEALALELAHGVEHGLVLGLDRDQVLARAL